MLDAAGSGPTVPLDRDHIGKEAPLAVTFGGFNLPTLESKGFAGNGG